MKTLLKVENLSVENNSVKILNDISININSNEILGIIGESGCGKSTLIRSLTNMLNPSEEIVSGKVLFNDLDLSKLNKEEMRKILGKDIGIVFQNPKGSLNPINKIRKQFIETIKSHEDISEEKCIERALDTLSKLNLNHCECLINSYPFELSGGMNQRVAIALAMIMKPELLIADEPTSALDVTVQAKVINELIGLKKEFGTSIIIVTHSMGVVSRMADKVAVMYSGEIIEYGDKDKILKNPAHPYTRALINSVPRINGGPVKGIPGAPPKFNEDIKGCRFAPRCFYSNDKCMHGTFNLQKIDDNHYAKCSVSGEYNNE